MLSQKVDFEHLSRDISHWTWREIQYGLKKQLITCSEARDYAVRVLSKRYKLIEDILIQLISNERDIDENGMDEIFNRLLEDENDQEIDSIVSKWAFAVIRESYLNKEGHHQESLYYAIEDVYVELGYPVEISPLVYYMPNVEDGKNLDERIQSYISDGERKWMKVERQP